MDKQLHYCHLCKAEFELCKYNHSRQKYCKRKICIRQRNKMRQADWRAKWRSRKGSSYDKDRSRSGKKRIRTSSIPPASNAEKAVTPLTERVFAQDNNTLNTLVDILETYIFIVHGVGVMIGGGDAQTLASSQSKVVEQWYEQGRSLAEASPLIHNQLEKINDIRNQTHYGAPPAQNSLPVQLAGSAPGP